MSYASVPPGALTAPVTAETESTGGGSEIQEMRPTRSVAIPIRVVRIRPFMPVLTGALSARIEVACVLNPADILAQDDTVLPLD